MKEKTNNTIPSYTVTFPGLEVAMNTILSGVRKLDCCMAAYSLPEEQEVNIIIQLSDETIPYKQDHISGFVYAPFINDALSETYYIRKDLHFIYTVGNNTLSCTDTSRPVDFNKRDALFRIIENREQQTCNCRETYTYTPTRKEDYIRNVQKAKEGIQSEKFDKTVLSRTKFIDSPPNPGALFQALHEKYTNAFVNLIETPLFGTWAGASPEILLSVDRHQVLRTYALAGTQAHRYDNISDAVWRQKEIEEQSYVSRYIINCFKHIRLRAFKEIGPKTVRAGNLLHLRTEYIIKLDDVRFENLPDKLLSLLHPTSAVCGMPKAEALSFIKAHEQHDRMLYAGFTGPVNIADETHYYVNLRCARLFDNGLLAYAGAGITSESDPEQEWEETEMKCSIITTIYQNL